jgi:hypothetical protein
MKSPEAVLAFMSNAFKGLSEGIEKLGKKVDAVEAAKKAKKPKKKAVSKPAVKAKAKKKVPVKRKVAGRKAKKMTASDEVLRIIKRYKKGVDVAKLIDKTGFADSKLRMIVSRAYRQGKIKRIARGVYVSV